MNDMRQRKIIAKREPLEIGPKIIAVVALVVIGSLIVVSKLVSEYQSSVVVGQNLRSSLVIASRDGQVGVISFDPVDRKITELKLSDLAIRSRSIGEYKLSQLYALGNYTDEGGRFVQQKMQGFLRLPIAGYLVVPSVTRGSVRMALIERVMGRDVSEISRLDGILLLAWSYGMQWHTVNSDTLIREGVIVADQENKFIVNDSRLQQFVGSKLFDWRVGAEGMTVAVVNESGVEGLGSDVAKFLVNVGTDVVSVRTGTSGNTEKTRVRVSSRVGKNSATMIVLRTIFGHAREFELDAAVEEYRSDVVVVVGTDMMDMF